MTRWDYLILAMCALWCIGFAAVTVQAPNAVAWMKWADHRIWSQEAAGWAQAVGTILAIVGALLIQEHGRKTTTYERNMLALAAAMGSAGALRVVFQIAAARTEITGMFVEMTRLRIESEYTALQGIPVADVPPLKVGSLLLLRGAIQDARALLAQPVEQLDENVDLTTSLFEGFMTCAAEVEEELKSAILKL